MQYCGDGASRMCLLPKPLPAFGTCTPLLQVRINAVLGVLPTATLQVTAGEVERVAAPRLDGAWQVHAVAVRLAAPNTPCNISIAAGGLAGGMPWGG